MTAPSQDLIDRLGVAATECRDLLREVHGATRDLRTAERDARRAIADLEATIATVCEREFNARMKVVVDEYAAQVTPGCERALDAAVAHVLKQFDTFRNLLNTRSPRGRGLDWRLAFLAKMENEGADREALRIAKELLEAEA